MSTVTFDILARDHASSTFRRVGNETQTLAGHLQGLSRVAGRAAAALGLYELGRATVTFGKDSVKAYAAAQTAQNKLTDAYKRFPALANVQIRALRQLNQALQDKTGTDHNALAAAEASLSQFNLTGEAIKKLTPLVNDYAVKTGQDVVTAATGVGRALLGNTRALKTVGINFKATGNQAKDAAALTGLLQAKLGGFAKREGKTAAGQGRVLAASFRDLEESVGKGLYRAFDAMLPTLNKFAGILRRDVAPLVGHVASAIGDHVRPALSVVANLFAAKVLPALRSFAGVVRSAVLPVLKGIGDFIVGHVIPAMAKLQGGALDGLRSAFHSISSAVGSSSGGLRRLFGVLKTVAGFILDRVAPIIGTVLRVALELVGKEMALWIRVLGHVGKAFHALADFFTGPFLRAVGDMGSVFFHVVKFIADVWLQTVGTIINGASHAFGWVPWAGKKLQQAAGAFNAFRANVDSTLTGLANDSGTLGAAGGAAYASGFMHAAAAGLAGNLNPNVAGGGTGGGAAAPAKRPKIKTPQFSYDPTALTLPATAAGNAAGKAAGNGVASGLSSTVSKVVDATKRIVDKINQQFKSLKDSAKQLAQSIADTMRATVDLTNISQTDSLGAAMAPTVANIKNYLLGVVHGDRKFKNLLKSEHARGLSTALFKALGLAGPQAAGGIVQALAGASRSDLRQISGLSAQAGQIGVSLGRSVSQDVYGGRLRAYAQRDREANRLLGDLVRASHGRQVDDASIRKLAHAIGNVLHKQHLEVSVRDTARHHGRRVRAS